MGVELPGHPWLSKKNCIVRLGTDQDSNIGGRAPNS